MSDNENKNEIYTVMVSFLEPRVAQFNVPAKDEEEVNEILKEVSTNLKEFKITYAKKLSDIKQDEETNELTIH